MIDDTIKKDAEQVIEEPKEITPEVKEEVKEPEVIDVDLGFVEKKKFRINGDFNRMLELNVSDLNVFSRLRTDYPKLDKLLKEAREKITSIPDDMENKRELLEKIADALDDIDAQMRALVDHIFDTNASEICAPSGNMFDPVGGQWRFVRIIDKLTALYTNGLNAEFNKIKANVDKRVSKYTNKKK